MAKLSPYSDLGRMLTTARKKKEKKQAQGRAEARLATRRTPTGMSQLNETSYVTENGLDREDARLRRENRKAFRDQVDSMVRRNEMQAMSQGKMYRNYPQLQAQRNGEQKKKRGNKW